MVPVNVYAYAVLSPPQILGFTSGYILIFLRETPQNLTRLHAYASGSPDDPCKLTLLDHGIVEGKGGSLNKELDFRSWHCGRQGGKFK